MTDTKAGRDPEWAVKEIEAPAQERSICPACDGTKRLVGRYIGSASREEPDESIFACSNCDDEGTVPAAQQGDLATWREAHNNLIVPGVLLEQLRNHLAAMPQAQPDAELLGALQHIAECDYELPCSHGTIAHRDVRETARVAIAQHEQGAAG